MKIKVIKVEHGSNDRRTIHFGTALAHLGRRSFEMLPAGIRAERILRMLVGTRSIMEFESPRQIAVGHRGPNKHLDTVAGLQAFMDKHSGTQLQVVRFGAIQVFGGTRNSKKSLRTPAEAEKFLWDNPRDGTFLITRDVHLNLPSDAEDGPIIGSAQQGMHCARWVTDRTIDMYAVRISIYAPDANRVMPSGGENPWALMKSLEPKIKAAVAATKW